MLGRDHALSGAVMFAAVAPTVLHVTPLQLAVGTVLTSGAALLPDADEPGSLISRSGGFVTRGFAHAVRWAARGHRHGTHSLLGAVVFTAAAWVSVAGSDTIPGRVALGVWLALMMTAALRVLPFARSHTPDVAGIAAAAGLCFFWRAGLALVPVCTGIGVLTHIAGDQLTLHGCPVFWPASQRDFHLLPQGLRFSTGKFAEHWVVSPLLTVGLALALAADSGLAHWPA